MRVLGKVMRCAEVDNKNWRQELYKFLCNYRATPHSSTGVAPFLLDEKIRVNDQRAKHVMREYADNRRTKKSKLRVGDKVLVNKAPRKKKSDSHYVPHPYQIVQTKGSMVTAQRERHKITRNSSQFKAVKVEGPIILLSEDEDEDAALGGEVQVDVGGDQNEARNDPRESDGRYPKRANRGQLPRKLGDFHVTVK